MSSVTVSLTPAALNFTGQSLVNNVTLLVSPQVNPGDPPPAVLSFAGQSVAFNVTAPLASTALDFAGQSIAGNFAVVLAPATVTWTGQDQVLTVALAMTAGALQFQGQTITLVDLTPVGKRGRLFLRPEGQRLASVWKGRLRLS